MKTFQSAEQALAYYTECNLATLERLQSKSRTPKCDIERQQSICDGMVSHCKSFVNAGDAYKAGALRLYHILIGK